MTHPERHDNTRTETNSFGVNQQDRQQILLDDLRHEIARLAEAVERQNELLAEGDRPEQPAEVEP